MRLVKIYDFFQDEKWYEDLGHILIGMIPLWGWIREHYQWPPSSNSQPFILYKNQVYYHQGRVRDVYRDFLGHAIGDAVRTVVVIAAWIITSLV